MDKLVFYFKPFLLICGLNLLLFFSLGSYYEEYEGMFSTFVQGKYTYPYIQGADVNVHFLWMRAYVALNRIFPEVQVYGLVLFVYNWMALGLIGLLIFRILRVNLGYQGWFLFGVLYLLVAADNVVHLSTTRIAFLLAAFLFGWLESRRAEKKNNSPAALFFLSLLAIQIALLRAEALFIASLVYLFFLLLYRRLHVFPVFAFLVSLLVFATHYITMTRFSGETKRIYYVYEKELVDRYEVKPLDTASVNGLELTAFLYYGISDRVHYSEEFYREVIPEKHDKGFGVLLNGITLRAFGAALRNSAEDIARSRYAMLFFLVMAAANVWSARGKRIRASALVLLAGLLPFVVCLNTMAPARFLIPYYSVMALWVAYSLLKTDLRPRLVPVLLTAVLCGWLFTLHRDAAELKRMESDYLQNMKRLEKLAGDPDLQKPVILSFLDIRRFFPTDPLGGARRMNAMFLNLYMLNAYEFYQWRWKEICPGDPLSLRDKMECLTAKDLVFVSDDRFNEFLGGYCRKKYGMDLEFRRTGAFDDVFNVYAVARRQITETLIPEK